MSPCVLRILGGISVVCYCSGGRVSRAGSVPDVSVMWEGLGGRGADVDDKSVRGQNITMNTSGNMGRPDKAADSFSGYSAWRNEALGSWFCQAFYAVLSRSGDKVDLLRLLTRVNRKVAYDFQSMSANPKLNAKKQIPCVMSMLTKELYFRKKRPEV